MLVCISSTDTVIENDAYVGDPNVGEPMDEALMEQLMTSECFEDDTTQSRKRIADTTTDTDRKRHRHRHDETI